jgi:alpha-beta hydrolase superfamily lysophospholipase
MPVVVSTGDDAGTMSDSSVSTPPATTPTGAAPTAASASKQGPYMVTSYKTGIPTTMNYVTPTIYYSTDAPGPMPGVVVIPGFTEQQGALSEWGTFLASYGFIVMMIDTASGGTANTGILPPARADGLMDGVTNLIAENKRSGSPAMGKIDTTRMAIMGHSMGGGGTLIAANAHSSEIKAAVGLNPWNPGGTYPMDTAPTLVFDGTADTLVPPSQGKPEYDSIPTTTPKAYVEFQGGTHFVALTPLGMQATDPIVARLGLSWLEVHVMGDMRYQQFIVKDSSMSTFDTKP